MVFATSFSMLLAGLPGAQAQIDPNIQSRVESLTVSPPPPPPARGTKTTTVTKVEKTLTPMRKQRKDLTPAEQQLVVEQNKGRIKI